MSSLEEKNTQEGFINVTGGKIWYQIVGVSKKKTPLLVLHGGPGATHDYLEPLAALSSNRPIIFYDQLGGGKSDRPEDKSLFNIHRFQEELHTLRNVLQLEKVYLLGHSWGCMLATSYILEKNAEGVLGLILSGPYLSTKRWISDQREHIRNLPPATQKTILDCEASRRFDSPEYQAAMLEFYKQHLCRTKKWPEALEKTFGSMGQAVYNHMWGPSEFTVTGTLKDYEIVEELSKIKIPVLFTAGAYDEAAPNSVRYYQSKIAGSKVHIFENASHSHHLEATNEYLKIVDEFLSSLE